MSVYLSLTSSPTRIQYLDLLLKEIDLSLFDKVLINIPQSFGRNSSTYNIPPSLYNIPKVKVIRIKKDKGPATKIIPGVLYAKNSNDIIISIDDDIDHNPKLFPLLINACREKDCVITGIGKNLNYWASEQHGSLKRQYPFDIKHKSPYVDLIEGFSGVAYKKKFFPNIHLLNKLTSISKDCYLSDDLVLSFYLKLFGRRIISLQKMKKYSYNDLQAHFWGLGNNALHRGGNGEIDYNYVKYPKCYKTLLKYIRENKSKVDSNLIKAWHHDFDEICVVNMKTRTNRKNQSMKILKSLGVPDNKIKIITATTPNNNMVKILNTLGLKGKTLKSFLSERRYKDLMWNKKHMDVSEDARTYYKKTLVETAVSISQLRVVHRAMKTNKTILMLEDDFGPVKAFYDHMTHRLHRSIDWDVLYVGDCGSMRSGVKKTVIKGENNKIITAKTVCHHAIAFRPALGRSILSKKPITPFDYPIDDALAKYMAKYKTKFGIFEKTLMTQDVDLGAKSNIQENNKIAWEIEESNKFQTLNLRKL